MASQRHLAHPPIVEALFDFRVKSRPDLRAEEFKPLRESLRDRFPRTETKVQLSFGFSTQRPTPAPSQAVQGYFLKTSDGNRVVQLRADGFTYNCLAPYDGWDAVFPDVRDLWMQYRDIARPTAITRTAVRYINHIAATHEDSIDVWLAAPPTVPQELPQSVSQFLYRVTLQAPDSPIAAHITQQLAARQDAQPTVILDIDVFSDVETAPADDAALDVFNDLRRMKNAAFFAMLTERAVERYE